MGGSVVFGLGLTSLKSETRFSVHGGLSVFLTLETRGLAGCMML